MYKPDVKQNKPDVKKDKPDVKKCRPAVKKCRCKLSLVWQMSKVGVQMDEAQALILLEQTHQRNCTVYPTLPLPSEELTI